MLDKAIETKSKAVFQSPTNAQEMDACYSKGRRLDKKEKTSKSHNGEKTKPADNQLLTLAETQGSGMNSWRTRENCCDQQLGQAAVGTQATGTNLVNTTLTNNFGDGWNRPLKDLS